jgi:hypothetical protein
MRLFCPRLVSCLLVGIASLLIARPTFAQCEFGIVNRTITQYVYWDTDGSFPEDKAYLIDQAVGEWTTHIAATGVGMSRASMFGVAPDIIVKLGDLPSYIAGESLLWIDPVTRSCLSIGGKA